MIADKRKFFTGFGMMVGFVIVLILFFSPVFDGKNGLVFFDGLYNSISKGSAYYIPKVAKGIRPFKGNSVELTLQFDDEKQVQKVSSLLDAAGAETTTSGNQLNTNGDLGLLLESCLSDADAMYYNDGDKVSGKYGVDEKVALYFWWKALKGFEKDLKRQKKFEEAKIVGVVVKKAVEASYNYYGIEPQKISDRLGLVIGSLIFYVIYTLWYGFAFMFMFEGWGMKLEH